VYSRLLICPVQACSCTWHYSLATWMAENSSSGFAIASTIEEREWMRMEGYHKGCGGYFRCQIAAWIGMSSRLNLSCSHILPRQVICGCTDCRHYTFHTPDNQLIYEELESLFANAYTITGCILPISQPSVVMIMIIIICCSFTVAVFSLIRYLFDGPALNGHHPSTTCVWYCSSQIY